MAAAESTQGQLPAESLEIEISGRPDLAALETEWRALEPHVSGLSFFQSWTWMGCLAEERFPSPVLLRARRSGRTVGLALFNRRGRRLLLAESGEPMLDAPFIEHNAPLIAGDPPIAETVLRAAWAVPGVEFLVLSGVPQGLSEAAASHVLRLQERLVPFVDLKAVRAQAGDYVASRSANTRQQIRRSMRHFSASGQLTLSAASSVSEAQTWLDNLIDLHTATWQRRGKPGAFATPWLRRFHATLVARAFARGELALVQLTAGRKVVGYLYNFRLGGRVYAYQSGLAAADGVSHARPGLCIHALAIQQALDRGDAVYDFLAGDARYKQSLATGSVSLVWAELVRPGLLGWILARSRALARQVLRHTAALNRTGPTAGNGN